MDKVIIKRDSMRKNGILYLCSAVVTAVLIWLLRDQFEKPVGFYVLAAVIILEFGIAIYTLVMSKGEDVLDQEGLTSHDSIGSQNHLWTDLQKFEIGYRYGKTKPVGMKQKIPYIRLVFTNPYRVVQLPYRKDIDQHIRCYWGEPTKDSWTNK